MEGIQIEEFRVGALKDILLLKVQGYVDTNTSPELQKTLGQFIEGGTYQFVIDMSAVQYVSSAGWGVFVGEIRRLQEKGGDLKITQMSAEVNEVFEMLEFHRILSSYDSNEEAIEDFDFYHELNDMVMQALKTPRTVPVGSQTAPVHEQPETVVQEEHVVESPKPRLNPTRNASGRDRDVEETSLPINEKIKRIVLENPILGVWAIKRMLYSPRFGYTRVGLWKLYKILKSLSMETKAKRYRYFRSR